MKKLIVLSAVVMIVTMTGCQSSGKNTPQLTNLTPLEQGTVYLEEGEFFKAKQIARELLKKNPDNEAAQKLMAQIIDGEIVRQSEVFDSKAPEEYTDDEKNEEIKTWLERSKSLKELHQYEEAVLAAEKVFTYDSNNLDASRLIDEIKGQAYKEGKAQNLVLSQMREGEIETRVNQYLEQAKNWMEQGRWGAARLAVEKSLLLQPENRDAISLYSLIKKRKEKINA